MLKSVAKNIKEHTVTNRRAVLHAILALVFFVACAIFFYLGGAASKCTTTLALGPGDQAAGPVWLNSVVNKPLWGHTNISNAPYGENLRSPVLITGAAQYAVFWIFALFTGPVCGYNLYTALGFVFSAMVMYFFIRSVTKRTDVAVFAGFAATFTPYLQSKTGVHPSYVFFGVFVLAFWLLINLWRKPNTKSAVALGLVISSFFYIDPYFLLLGGVTVGSMLLALLIRFAHKTIQLRARPVELKKNSKYAVSVIRKLIIAGAVVGIVGLLPSLFVRIKYAAVINAEVSSARSPIKQEARTYAARVAEYIWPAPQNPYIGRVGHYVPSLLQRKPHGSNSAENTLSLSWVVLALVAFVVITWLVSSVKKQPKFSAQQQVILGVALLVATIAFLTSLPPDFRGVPFPSGIITSFIEIWRVFARLQVVVVFTLVIIASLGLSLLTKNLSRAKRLGLVALAIILVGIEYLTFTPLKDNRAWSYSQVHSFYYWLKNQGDIKTIAEYPLNEPGQTSVSVSYFTDQYIHKKHLLNAYRAASHQSVIRNGLRDITDPETPTALAALGVDLLVVHAEDQKPIPTIPGLQEVDWNQNSIDTDSIYIGGKMWVFRVIAQPDPDGLILAPGAGYSELRINSTYTSAESLFDSTAQLVTLDLKEGGVSTKKSVHTATLDTNTTNGEAKLTLLQNKKVLWSGIVGRSVQSISFTLDTSLPITLRKSDPTQQNKISINNLNLL